MITGVALFNTNTGELVSLPNPNRHNHVISKMFKEMKVRPLRQNGWIQGFIDDQANFLDREQAAEHALECKQIKVKLDILFSEDLW
jgi:hypothetical protein